MKRKPDTEYRAVMVNGVSRMVHVMRAEAALGKPLPLGAVVHHADGSRRDTAPLVICQDKAYHQLLHVRMRVVRAGGNPNTERLCSTCKNVKPFAEFNSWKQHKSVGLQGICRACQVFMAREYWRKHNWPGYSVSKPERNTSW